MKLSKEDLMVNIFKCTQGIFDIYCQSKTIADFYNLEGKLKPLTLIHMSGFGLRIHSVLS